MPSCLCETRGTEFAESEKPPAEPGSRWVSFMYSYPMLIPLPAREVESIASALEPWQFERTYGAWWGRVVDEEAKGVVRRSAQRYVRALV